MRILELKSENFKKIKAIDITPKEDIVEITGANAEGKTSVLDSIWAALKNKGIPEKPIREGQKKATIILNIGKYIIKRTFTEKGSLLTVVNAEGATFKSPQKMLDEFVGDLSFDPLEFIKMDEKEQVQLLLKIVKFNIDINALKALGIVTQGATLQYLDTVKINSYQERTRVNRDMHNREEQLKSMPEVEKVEKVSIAELFKHKTKLETQAKAQEGIRLDLETAKTKLKEYNEEIANLEKEIKKKKQYVQEELDTIKNLTKRITAFKDLTPAIKEISQTIKNVDKVNAQFNDYERREAVLTDYAKIKAESENLSKLIIGIDEIKNNAVSSTQMPTEGLNFNGQSITYQGIPIMQTSSSEQLRISLAIAIALNPKLRIIRISDGSLLDSKNMQILRKTAKEHDMQIWIEKVDESGKIGFYIEDGEIKNAA